ncbi:MAG: hypothetical protein HZB82_01120 [Deltaproteobacteria bacterium]|nr:hypothetical protein [Deltaproteobacteria bacterium]
MKIERIKKIAIKKVAPELKSHNGLFGEGCTGSRCGDECCQWGCDVDLATLDLIMKHRDLVEPLVGRKIEKCFKTELVKDDDYIGGAFRETVVRKADKRCAFHLTGGTRGCSLFFLWAAKGISKRIVPTICRVYPITWHRGRLFLDSPIIETCKCLDKPPTGKKPPSLLQTQRKEVRALFNIKEK